MVLNGWAAEVMLVISVRTVLEDLSIQSINAEQGQLGDKVERTKVVQSCKFGWLLERSWRFRLYFTR